jgi:hypothetical protein
MGPQDFVFTDCMFANNSRADGRGRGSDNGGSVIQILVGIGPISASFTNCEFTDNSVRNGQGGAVSASAGNNALTIEFTHCVFTRNSADLGGGAIFLSPAVLGLSAIVAHCTFVDNTCTGNCGGASAGGAIAVVPTEIFGTDYKNDTVCIIDSQFMQSSGNAVNAAGFNDIYQNDTYGSMIQFCCPAPSPLSSTLIGKSHATCVAMPTIYLLVDQLPPSQQIVHCPPPGAP